MILNVLTLVHVLISLAGIGSGWVVLFGVLGGKALPRWTAWFLTTTIATSVTGFFFPVHHFMPSHGVGILSLLLLTIAVYARYSRNLNGAWRKTYVITAVFSLYLNIFVGVVQSFQKVPALKALAPTQTEQPFKVTQLCALVLFIILGVFAAIRFGKQSANPLPPLH